MKKLALLTGLILALTSLTSALEVTEVNFDLSNPEVGETIDVTATAEGDDLEYIEARLPGKSTFESRNCGIGRCDNEGDPWTFTPDSSGSYTVEVRAGSLFDQSPTVERTVQVGSEEPDIPVSLEFVGASRNFVSNDQPTQLQADVRNSDPDIGRRVNVKWFAEEGGDSIRLDEDTETIYPDSESRLFSGFFYWDDLKDKGLEVGKEYDLRAELYFDGDQVDSLEGETLQLGSSGSDEPEASLDVSPTYADPGESITFDASGSTDDEGIVRYEFDFDNDGNPDLITNSDEHTRDFSSEYSGDARVEVFDEDGNSADATDFYEVSDQDDGDDSNLNVDLFDPEGDITDRTPEYRWRFNDDVNDDMESVEIAVDDDSTPFVGSLHEESFDSFDSEADANEVIEFQPSFSWRLDRGEDYTWGIRADNGDTEEEETEEFTVEQVTDDPEDGDLTVTVRDDDGDRLENAEVTVENGEYEEDETGFNGEADFYNLEVGDYGLEVQCESESEEEDIYVAEGDNEETVYMDFSSSDNECDDEEDQDPVARFDYSSRSPDAGEEVEFDASSSSDDNGIDSYDWDFDDGSTASGRTPEHTFDSRGDYRVELEVEDYDGNTDRAFRTVNVGRNPGACGITDDSFDFTLEDYTIRSGGSTRAELEVFNTGSDDQEVEVEIKVGNSIVRQRTLTVQSQDSRTVTADVSPEVDSFVSADVRTSGDSCGTQEFIDLSQLTRELTVLDSSEDQGSLEVSTVEDDGTPVSGVRIEVEGPEDRTRYTDSQGKTGFELEPGDYDVTASSPRYRTESEDVEIQSGDDKDIQFELRERDDYSTGDGTLEVTVLDEDGDWIRDARVRVENGDDRTLYTDRYGFTDFRLEEDRYDIEVSHPDYDETEYGTAYVESGETVSRTFRLDRYDDVEDEGLEITSVDYPDSVCRGSTLSVDYQVRNNGDYDESAQTTASGLERNIVTDNYVIDSGESVTGTLRFTNVQGSGREDFTIRVQNGTSDRVTRTVRVNDCTSQRPDTDQGASAVSMKLSYPISPNRALVGDTVKVSGFVDGVTGRSSVNIDVNGERAARVSTQPDGYYQTYIRADSVGSKTVRASSGGNSASRTLKVLPTASVGALDAPQQVFEGQQYEVCTSVNSQVEARIVLLRDGRVLEETNANGEVCFDRTATQPGSHVYVVRALTTTETSTSSTSVRVLETDVEASSFPDQVASVESGDGLVKVELYNTHNELKRYKLDLRGLPSTWLSQSSKEVILASGERETVYFYLTPRDEGTYSPEIVVSGDNQEIYRENVDLEVGGQMEKQRRGFVSKLSSLFSL